MCMHAFLAQEKGPRPRVESEPPRGAARLSSFVLPDHGKVERPALGAFNRSALELEQCAPQPSATTAGRAVQIDVLTSLLMHAAGRAMRGGMRPTPRATCHDHGPRASWQGRGTLLAGCWLRRNAIPSLGPYRPRAVRSRASSSRRHGVDRSRRQGCATPGEPAYAKALLGHAARVIQRWPGNITHVEWLGGSESGSGNVCK